MSLDLKLARIAYESYSAVASKSSLAAGDPLPLFDELPEEMQAAWIAAAEAIKSEVVRPRRAIVGPDLYEPL
jgi:hypothetical protein